MHHDHQSAAEGEGKNEHEEISEKLQPFRCMCASLFQVESSLASHDGILKWTHTRGEIGKERKKG